MLLCTGATGEQSEAFVQQPLRWAPVGGSGHYSVLRGDFAGQASQRYCGIRCSCENTFFFRRGASFFVACLVIWPLATNLFRAEAPLLLLGTFPTCWPSLRVIMYNIEKKRVSYIGGRRGGEGGGTSASKLITCNSKATYCGFKVIIRSSSSKR